MLNNMHKEKERAGAFDTIAADYEKFRPGYPIELGQFIELEAKLKKGSDLLEIGVGPGQATKLFHGKNYNIIGIDPGKNLLEVAQKTYGNSVDLIFEESTFEAWEPEERTFDLVYSGSAFHWVNPDIGFPKVANIMRSKGSFALFWNMFPDVEGKVWESIGDAYRQIVPEMAKERSEKNMTNLINDRLDQISNTKLFGKISIHKFPWEKEFTSSEYLRLLSTYSDHIILVQEIREELFAKITAIIDGNGGTLIRPWTTVLFLMKK